jgi:hypothetical protein
MPRRGGPLHPVGSVEAIVSVEALPLGFEIDGTHSFFLFLFFSRLLARFAHATQAEEQLNGMGVETEIKSYPDHGHSGSPEMVKVRVNSGMRGSVVLMLVPHA